MELSKNFTRLKVNMHGNHAVDVYFRAWGKSLSGSTNPFAGQVLTTLIKRGLVPEFGPFSDRSVFVLMEHENKVLKYLRARYPQAKFFLVVFEPESVRPDQHAAKTLKRYDQIFFQSPLQIKDHANSKLWQPGFLKGSDNKQFVSVRKLPNSNLRGALINENKFSFVPNSNYSLRRDVIGLASEIGIDLTVAGRGWEISPLKNLLMHLKVLIFQLKLGTAVDLKKFRFPLKKSKTLHLHGPITNKFQFLENFDYTLVIENDPNYVSEKLFDAITSNCLPIYVGPNLNLFNLPAEIAVQAPANKTQIINSILHLSSDDFATWEVAAQNFLNHCFETREWTEQGGIENLVDKLIDAINENY